MATRILSSARGWRQKNLFEPSGPGHPCHSGQGLGAGWRGPLIKERPAPAGLGTEGRCRPPRPPVGVGRALREASRQAVQRAGSKPAAAGQRTRARHSSQPSTIRPHQPAARCSSMHPAQEARARHPPGAAHLSLWAPGAGVEERAPVIHELPPVQPREQLLCQRGHAAEGGPVRILCQHQSVVQVKEDGPQARRACHSCRRRRCGCTAGGRCWLRSWQRCRCCCALGQVLLLCLLVWLLWLPVLPPPRGADGRPHRALIAVVRGPGAAPPHTQPAADSQQEVCSNWGRCG